MKRGRYRTTYGCSDCKIKRECLLSIICNKYYTCRGCKIMENDKYTCLTPSPINDCKFMHNTKVGLYYTIKKMIRGHI